MSYSFNSNALGFGGIITSPNRAMIPSVASAVLAPAGGFGSATVTDYRYGNLVSIGEARSEVFGVPASDGGYAAKARVLLTNVNINDSNNAGAKEVLHADYLEATVTSVKQRDVALPLITFRAIFEGVTVFGQQLDPQIDSYDDQPTYDGFLNTLRQNLIAAGGGQNNDGIPQSDGETLRTCLLRDFRDCPPAVRNGKVIEVPSFGRVYLAEVLVKRSRRRLSMLRLHLDPTTLTQGAEAHDGGGGTSGDFSGGSADSNGTEITP